jgi:TetR/AcrR family transcriptional regulator
MTASSSEEAWAERAAARSPVVQRSRSRSIQQATQIVDAAMALVDEKGSSFTIQELAANARVALQTFYRHFSGKDELLLAVIERTIAENCADFAQLARQLPDPLSRLRFYITAAVTSLDDDAIGARSRFITSEHYRLHQIFPDALIEANRRFTDLLVPEITEASEAGLLAPADVEGDAWYVTELVMATFHHYAFATKDVPAEQLAESLWHFCLAALGGAATPPPTAPRASGGRKKKSA